MAMENLRSEVLKELMSKSGDSQEVDMVLNIY